MPSPRTTLTTLVTLMLTLVAAQASAQGETCESAMTIPVPFTGNFDNSRAFADGPPGSCNSFTLTEMSNSQWFSFNAPQAGAVIVTITEVTPFDMIACLYTGRCGSTLTEQACGDQPEPVVMRIAVTQGMPVIIAVGDWGGPGGGDYELSIDFNITCPADTNHDGVVTPADFSAWVAAYNAMAPECDQNNDGMCTPADFSAWVANYNAGC